LERRRTGQAAGDIVGSATLGGSATYEYGSCNTLKQARHRLTYLVFCFLPLDIAEPEHQRPSGWCDRQFGSHSTWVQRYRAACGGRRPPRAGSPRAAAHNDSCGDSSVGLGNALGRRTSGTAQVLLGSAVAALAVSTAIRSAEALPAVESESASPGLGHRGLLGCEPYRLGQDSVVRCGKNTVVLRPSLPGRRSGSATRPGR
jgi:hypothetical protein